MSFAGEQRTRTPPLQISIITSASLGTAGMAVRGAGACCPLTVAVSRRSRTQTLRSLRSPPRNTKAFPLQPAAGSTGSCPAPPPRRGRVALSALALTFSSMEGGWAGQQGPGGSRHSPTNTSPPPLLPDRVHNPTHCPTCLLYFAQQFDWPDLVNWRGSLLCFLLPIRLPRSFPGESEPFEESSD